MKFAVAVLLVALTACAHADPKAEPQFLAPAALAPAAVAPIVPAVHAAIPAALSYSTGHSFTNVRELYHAPLVAAAPAVAVAPAIGHVAVAPAVAPAVAAAAVL